MRMSLLGQEGRWLFFLLPYEELERLPGIRIIGELALFDS
jgi:hypothetical protein